jgi:hypothetical protein
MYLAVAVFWFLVAVGLLLWPVLEPERVPPLVGQSGTFAAAVALLLALYNVVRWWAARALARQHQATLEATRRRAEARAHPRPWQEPDPTFDFTEQSPPPPESPDGAR